VGSRIAAAVSEAVAAAQAEAGEEMEDLLACLSEWSDGRQHSNATVVSTTVAVVTGDCIDTVELQLSGWQRLHLQLRGCSATLEAGRAAGVAAAGQDSMGYWYTMAAR
jgi:hypothetical protein